MWWIVQLSTFGAYSTCIQIEIYIYTWCPRRSTSRVIFTGCYIHGNSVTVRSQDLHDLHESWRILYQTVVPDPHIGLEHHTLKEHIKNEKNISKPHKNICSIIQVHTSSQPLCSLLPSHPKILEAFVDTFCRSIFSTSKAPLAIQEVWQKVLKFQILAPNLWCKSPANIGKSRKDLVTPQKKTKPMHAWNWFRRSSLGVGGGIKKYVWIHNLPEGTGNSNDSFCIHKKT